MSGKELWERFVEENNLVKCHDKAWAFGVDTDLLAHFVVVMRYQQNTHSKKVKAINPQMSGEKFTKNSLRVEYGWIEIYY